jgi:enoyl-CoA hydratase
LELLLGGDIIGAEEAYRIGLVNRIADNPLIWAKDWARKLTGKAPIALKLAKEAVHKGLDMTLDQGLRLEADLYFLLHTTQDRIEGIRAFLEKREAKFKGE